MSIEIKNERELEAMRRAGRVVALVLDVLKNSIRAGMKTGDLNDIAERKLKTLGGRSSFKGYRVYGLPNYPASLCVSINDEIVHGIPGERIIKEGDIVSLDFGAIVDGFHGDAAITVMVGEVSSVAKALVNATHGALAAGISAVKNGGRLGDISSAIQRYAEARGFSVIRKYTGHGIGHEMHEDPLVFNFGEPGTGPELKKGMTLALEPMLTTGSWETKGGEHEWLVSTADGSLSAHFEHTVAVTADKAEILTRV